MTEAGSGAVAICRRAGRGRRRRWRRLPVRAPGRGPDRLHGPLPRPTEDARRRRRRQRGEYCKYAAIAGPGRTPLDQRQSGRARRRARRVTSSTPTRACDTAWQVSTGRPDVTIAVLDSGIKWNDDGRDERPALQDPAQPGRAAGAAQRRPATPNEPGADCTTARPYARRRRRRSTATASSTSATSPATTASIVTDPRPTTVTAGIVRARRTS